MNEDDVIYASRGGRTWQTDQERAAAEPPPMDVRTNGLGAESAAEGEQRQSRERNPLPAFLRNFGRALVSIGPAIRARQREGWSPMRMFGIRGEGTTAHPGSKHQRDCREVRRCRRKAAAKARRRARLRG